VLRDSSSFIAVACTFLPDRRVMRRVLSTLLSPWWGDCSARNVLEKDFRGVAP